MSAIALQRFIVRLQLDESLGRRLAAHPNKALQGIDLSADERRWLLNSDFRAYTSDPLFAPRILHAIVGEYAASCGLAVAHSKHGSRVLLAFFRSARAHRAVQGGQSLSLAFGDWLKSRVTVGVWSDARIAELARLEQTMARLRRPVPVRGALTRLVETVRTRIGTSILYSEILNGLASHGDVTAAALQGEADYRSTARLQAGTEWILCRTTYRGPAGSQSLEVLPDALAALIEEAASGSTREQVLAHARALGADAGEDEAIIADLESDQVLVFSDH